MSRHSIKNWFGLNVFYTSFTNILTNKRPFAKTTTIAIRITKSNLIKILRLKLMKIQMISDGEFL